MDALTNLVSGGPADEQVVIGSCPPPEQHGGTMAAAGKQGAGKQGAGEEGAGEEEGGEEAEVSGGAVDALSAATSALHLSGTGAGAGGGAGGGGGGGMKHVAEAVTGQVRVRLAGTCHGGVI